MQMSMSRVFQTISPQAGLWGDGQSKDEFTELAAASKYLENAPLANLAAALRDRANTDTERIELFQTKLPPSAIPKYGFAILILCQLYLLAHLQELRRTIA